MTIEGDYALFAHLETVYLGTMARRSLVMRNVREVVEAAAASRSCSSPPGHDHWLVQTGDGWAAHVAGAIGVSTDAQASWWGGRGVGHGPARADRGLRRRHRRGGRRVRRPLHAEMNVTVLVDFENDSPATAVAVADALGDRLWGVRLDTSGTLVDRSLWDDMERSPVPTDRPASTSGWSPGRARRSTRPGTSGCGSSSPAASPPSGSRSRARRASPSTLRRRLFAAARRPTYFTADVVR
jgi:hypothetical protein